MIKCPTQTLSTIMLTAENYPALLAAFVLPKHEALEVHRSKSLCTTQKLVTAIQQYGYRTPSRNLPAYPSRIYQTIYNGSLAFLTVISPTENASKASKTSVFARRRSPVRIRLGKSFFYQSETVMPSVEPFSARG